MGNVTLNKVIEDFKDLSWDDKEYAVDLIKKQLIEVRRVFISKRAKEAVTNLKKGKVKTGTVKELFQDLEND